MSGDDFKYPCPHHEALEVTINSVCGKIDQLRKDFKWVIGLGVLILIALFGYTNFRITNVEDAVHKMSIDMATVKSYVVDIPALRKDHVKLDHRVTIIEEKISKIEKRK